jgi:lysophospholipid acyltransferase (LPLAT)-like uncharacterized protein
MKQKLRKFKQDTLRYLGHYFLYHLLQVLCKSLKITIENGEVIENFKKENKDYVLAFWHGTMLLPWYLHRNMNMMALISKSKDGDLLTRLLKGWNYQVVRGSSSKGGDTALGIMIDFARNKNSIAITPDGPKGPAYKLKAGAVITAKKSSLPLVLLGVGFRSKKILEKSWDKFQVPKFFSSVKAIYSEPIYVERNLSYEQTSEVINVCEARLNELQKKAEKFN